MVGTFVKSLADETKEFGKQLGHEAVDQVVPLITGNFEQAKSSGNGEKFDPRKAETQQTPVMPVYNPLRALPTRERPYQHIPKRMASGPRTPRRVRRIGSKVNTFRASQEVRAAKKA